MRHGALGERQRRQSRAFEPHAWTSGAPLPANCGYDLTTVQYAALVAIKTRPGIDQATLAGLIAYDRTTITGVVDRLVQKGLAVRQANSRDRRVRELQITDEGCRILCGIEPAV